MEKKVVSVQISDVKGYENNAKKHSEEQIAKIVESIEAFGYVNYIVVDENKEVLAGHGRLEAIKKLGRPKIDVIMMTGLTQAQKKKFRLIDNRTAELSTRDNDMLIRELTEMGDVDLTGMFEGLVNIYNVNYFDTPATPGHTPEGGATPVVGNEEQGRNNNNYSIRYELIFDDDAQKTEFMEYLAKVKELGTGSIAKCLTDFLSTVVE